MDQICRHAAFREGGEREDVGPSCVEMLRDGGKLVDQGVEDAVELGVHRLSVGLVVNRVQQRLDPAPRRLRGDRHQVGGVVGSASLPGGAGQGGADRLDQAPVGVAGDQGDSG